MKQLRPPSFFKRSAALLSAAIVWGAPLQATATIIEEPDLLPQIEREANRQLHMEDSDRSECVVSVNLVPMSSSELRAHRNMRQLLTIGGTSVTTGAVIGGAVGFEEAKRAKADA